MGVAAVYTPKDFQLNRIMLDLVALADPAPSRPNRLAPDQARVPRFAATLCAQHCGRQLAIGQVGSKTCWHAGRQSARSIALSARDLTELGLITPARRDHSGPNRPPEVTAGRVARMASVFGSDHRRHPARSSDLSANSSPPARPAATSANVATALQDAAQPSPDDVDFCPTMPGSLRRQGRLAGRPPFPLPAARIGSPPDSGGSMTVHIGAKPGEIAETVLLPGDPYRARWAAADLPRQSAVW